MRISKATLNRYWFTFVMIAMAFASGCSLRHNEITEIASPSSTMVYLSPTDITETIIVESTQTPMPLPTLSTTEAINLVRELLITNGNCELPCWWGIIPGQSTWDQTRTFFKTFATEIISSTEVQGGEVYNRGGILYSVNFPNPEGESLRDIEVLIFVNDNGIISIMGIPGIEKTIQNILEDYGVPAEVWLKFTGEWPGEYKDYSIALYYPDRGMMFVFGGQGNSVLHDGEKYLMMCSYDLGDHAGPWLWSPQTPILFEDIALLRLATYYDIRYGRINEVTNMDENSFYRAFVAGPACFETPYSVWPINPPTRTP